MKSFHELKRMGGTIYEVNVSVTYDTIVASKYGVQTTLIFVLEVPYSWVHVSLVVLPLTFDICFVEHFKRARTVYQDLVSALLLHVFESNWLTFLFFAFFGSLDEDTSRELHYYSCLLEWGRQGGPGCNCLCQVWSQTMYHQIPPLFQFAHIAIPQEVCSVSKDGHWCTQITGGSWTMSQSNRWASRTASHLWFIRSPL